MTRPRSRSGNFSTGSIQDEKSLAERGVSSKVQKQNIGMTRPRSTSRNFSNNQCATQCRLYAVVNRHSIDRLVTTQTAIPMIAKLAVTLLFVMAVANDAVPFDRIKEVDLIEEIVLRLDSASLLQL